MCLELVKNNWFWYVLLVLVVVPLTYSLIIGHLFSSRLKKTLVMQTKHGDAFVKFNETFPPAIVDKWERMVAEWDADKS
jgi:hypothetical protein